jgi:hypothetical protein
MFKLILPPVPLLRLVGNTLQLWLLPLPGLKPAVIKLNKKDVSVIFYPAVAYVFAVMVTMIHGFSSISKIC